MYPLCSIGETLNINLSDSVDPAMLVGELFADGPMKFVVVDVNGNQVQVEAPEKLQFVRGGSR